MCSKLSNLDEFGPDLQNCVAHDESDPSRTAVHCQLLIDFHLHLLKTLQASESAVFVVQLCTFCFLVCLMVLRHLRRRDSSRITQQIGTCHSLNELRVVLTAALVSIPWCLVDSWVDGRFLSVAMLLADAIVSVRYTHEAQGAVQMRIELVEEKLRLQLGSERIGRLRTLTYGLGLAVFALLPLLFFVCNDRFGSVLVPMTIFNFLRGASYLATIAFSSRAFSRACQPLKAGCKLDGYLREEAEWALRIMVRMRSSVTLLCTLSAVAYLALFAATVSDLLAPGILHEDITLVAQPCAYMCIGLVELMCLYKSVGFNIPEQPDIDLEPLPLRSATDTPLDGSHSDAWRDTLESLASRSISVGQLLEFAQKLGVAGGTMPHFRPDMSTTKDVVRQAVIPLSRTSDGGGTSYAEVCSPGREYPHVMVTHCWDSLFIHLVAAVVSDALGLEDYSAVAGELEDCFVGACAFAVPGCGKFEELRARLSDAGTLHRRYWICALCVNQHASICSSFAPEPQKPSRCYDAWDKDRRDSVTNAVFNFCGCNAAKHFNNSPDLCELNKFDDMMELLNRRVEGLAQLVAVDGKFDLFSRAWCLAEIKQAHASKIKQRVQVLSRGDIVIDAEDLNVYVKLVHLTVADCKASRAEDKAAIMARIPDVQEFDLHLQAMIFGNRGLLARHVVGFGVLEAAALIARRVAAAVKGRGEDVEHETPSPWQGNSARRVLSRISSARRG
uniref:Uncharacterized protein n=1 Tax=Zooxanthella nutricula TaxID=1333877 RepID=A0A7S2J972_9DINO